MTDQDQASAILEFAAKTLGTTVQDLLAGAVQQAAKQVTKRDIKVTVLEGEQAKKFGDVSISKDINGKGTFRPKLGVRATQLDALIEDLQAAKEILNG